MPEKSRPYYGWVILLCAAWAMVATLPGRSIGLGLINQEVMRSFDIDQVSYTQLNLISVFLGALFCIPLGALGDRFGLRPVVAGVMLLLGATVIWMSTIDSRPALAVAMTLLRGLGESSLSVVSLALVGKWFSRRISLAMGIFSVLIACGFVGALLTTEAIVKKYDWREAWQWVGAFVATGGVVVLLLVRNRPQDSIAMRDEFSQRGELIRASSIDFTLAQALRTSAFWCYALGSTIYILTFSAITFSSKDLLQKQGFPEEDVQSFLPIVAGMGVVCNLVGGALGMKIRAGKLLGATLVVLAIALAMFPEVTTKNGLLAFAAIVGGAGGVITVVYFSVWAECYGRLHLGRIQGAAQICSVIGSAVGPLMLALCDARLGSYGPFFYANGTAAVLLGLACLFVPVPLLTQNEVAATA